MAAGSESTAKAKEARRVVTHSDIKFNKENALLAALACVPGVSVVIYFIEKDDLFVKYYAAQYSLFLLLYLVVWIPIVGWLLPLFILIMTIMGAIKAYKGEKWDIPVVSKIAIDIMNKI